MINQSSRTLAETTIKMLGDRWKVQIIECLMDGTKRFGELKRELGDITQKVLTSNLRMLEENGILVRHVYAEIPPHVDYTLTTLGYNLRPVIDSMIAWAEEYREAIIEEFNQKLEESKLTLTESRTKLGNTIELGKMCMGNAIEQGIAYMDSALEQGKTKLENKINKIKNKF